VVALGVRRHVGGAPLFGAWWTWGVHALTAFIAVWWSRLLIGVAVVVVLSVFLWWLASRLPKHQAGRLRHAIRDPERRADVEDNFG
jgi:uncharacterized membrane protein